MSFDTVTISITLSVPSLSATSYFLLELSSVYQMLSHIPQRMDRGKKNSLYRVGGPFLPTPSLLLQIYAPS